MDERMLNDYIQKHTKIVHVNEHPMVIVCNLRIENISIAALSIAYPLNYYSVKDAVIDFFDKKMFQIEKH